MFSPIIAILVSFSPSFLIKAVPSPITSSLNSEYVVSIHFPLWSVFSSKNVLFANFSVLYSKASFIVL